MTPRYPILTARKVRTALERCGFVTRRQTGSHLIFRHPETGAVVVLPMHRRPLQIGTLRSVLKQAHLTLEQFVEFL